MNPYNVKSRFINELKSKPVSLVFSKWLTDRTPFIFTGNREALLEWKESFSSLIGIDGNAISIMGSAALGFSLNPYKQLKYFNNDSDIDVAIVSSHYFDISWHRLKTLGTDRYRLNYKENVSLEEHRTRLIYWGIIAADKLLTFFPFGAQWFRAISEMQSNKYINNHKINIRLYKDFESLRAYNIDNLNKLKISFFKTNGGNSESVP